MAKKQKAEKQTEEELLEGAKEGKKMQRNWRRLTFWTLPPILLVALFIFIVQFFGIPVKETALELGNKIPVVKKYVPDPVPVPATNKKQPKPEVEEWKRKYQASQKKVAQKDEEIAELTSELKGATKDVEATKQKLEELKIEVFELQQQLDEQKSEAVAEQMKQLASIYKTLPPKKAAELLATMSLEDAAITLSQLNTSQQTSILGSMKDAKKAAKLSLLIKEVAALKATDLVVLKAQIHQIALQQENPTETLAETLSGMQPTQAAGIIKSMMATNSYTAIELLKNIDTGVRAQLLSEIQKTDANMAAEIAAGLNR